MLELRSEIQNRVPSEMGREQREYMLRQQLRAIQEELGEKAPGQSEVEELRRRFEEAELPESVRREAERELDRLATLQPPPGARRGSRTLGRRGLPGHRVSRAIA